MKIIQSPRAVIDLWEIADYIAQNNPSAAGPFIEQCRQLFQTISSVPGMGTGRDEIVSELRSVPLGNYLVFFMPSRSQLLIVRVIHGAELAERVQRVASFTCHLEG